MLLKSKRMAQCPRWLQAEIVQELVSECAAS